MLMMVVVFVVVVVVVPVVAVADVIHVTLIKHACVYSDGDSNKFQFSPETGTIDQSQPRAV